MAREFLLYLSELYNFHIAMYCIIVYNITYLSVRCGFLENYQDYCEIFYAAHYLPIALYQGEHFLCASGFYNKDDPYPFVRPKLLEHRSPSVYVSSDTGYYGLVKCGDGLHTFVLGPAYSTPVTKEFVRSYIRKNALSTDQYDEVASFLSSIPQYTYNQFLSLLLFLHYSFTGEKLDIGQAFGITDTQFQQEIAQRHTREGYQELEHHQQHGTYQFERQMLALIRNGDVEQLEQFFVAAANAPKAQEGKLAETPLRQAKNIFIGWATMVGKDAAIPGGLDIEQTYRLIDTYIQECEKLQSEDAIKNLQYNMPMDFARRVAQQKLPKNISREVYGCMQFIGSHINEPIQVEDVVAFSGTSRAYLFQKFRQELGMGIGAYLLQCRLREAKFLLRFTDKSLGEISSYLCFSSQSHFQNQFKKNVGQTPAQYRKQQQA